MAKFIEVPFGGTHQEFLSAVKDAKEIARKITTAHLVVDPDFGDTRRFVFISDPGVIDANIPAAIEAVREYFTFMCEEKWPEALVKFSKRLDMEDEKEIVNTVADIFWRSI